MATNSATFGSFSERREVKRLESVDLQDDEDDSEAIERSTSLENIRWDEVLQSIRTNFTLNNNCAQLVNALHELYLILLQASGKIVAEEICVPISTFKRMKSATGYTNTQLDEGFKQFRKR